MSQFDELIATAKGVGMDKRNQFLQYLLNVVQKSKNKLTSEDKQAILDFAYEQVDVCTASIPEAANYREKDQIFTVEDLTLGIIMTLSPTPATIPEDKLMKIKNLTAVVSEERKIETTLESLFQQDTITDTDMNRLLYWVKRTGDEYQRSVLFAGLLHYRGQLSKVTEDAAVKLSNHIREEMERILAMEEITGEPLDALEMLCDVCKLFPSQDTPSLLNKAFALNENRISYYAAESLVYLGAEPPRSVIEALANDLVHANLLYGTLAQQGRKDLFPAELSSEEYLAKSDLVHWLCYPTELGKAPDEIQYIGKIKYLFRKEVYHVFKYRSDSETLGDDLRGKWLIGWSSADGGTFSNFDEFEKFDQGITDKTLKVIKKKLIG